MTVVGGTAQVVVVVAVLMVVGMVAVVAMAAVVGCYQSRGRDCGCDDGRGDSGGGGCDGSGRGGGLPWSWWLPRSACGRDDGGGNHRRGRGRGHGHCRGRGFSRCVRTNKEKTRD